MVDIWQKVPRDEQIPLMKYMFDFAIRTVLFAAFDFDCNDDQRVCSVNESYKIVSVDHQSVYQ